MYITGKLEREGGGGKSFESKKLAKGSTLISIIKVFCTFWKCNQTMGGAGRNIKNKD